MNVLLPDPGVLPTLPSPLPGESISLAVEGLPPYKDRHFSIRNPRHPKYDRFARLRCAATEAMNGRQWYTGPVTLALTLFAPERGRNIIDYIAGIQDTLDGSHGRSFTYLPVVFQDDCQVVSTEARFVKSKDIKYLVEVGFLKAEAG
jgi:hypothetical protein